MIIKIDSRETLPLEFDHPYVEEIVVGKLDVGDYMVEYKDGHVPPISFERKNLHDLFGTLANKDNHIRFRKELIRAQVREVKLYIIVEGTLSKVLKGISHSKVKGLSVIRALFTIYERYGVMPIFCKDRKEMALFIIEYFIGVGKERIKHKR